ncbi:MAG: hypothetical protein QS748_06285 [Candidatus Endonucleobacter bathymodioli]|uniref:Uncharacterized protein n=1 Tax=Candidatus Endonucleibacter bathymodioli TaxID=539814 RepID=A0AA90SMG3_9GAMM|nr:hypothetical protein [Candidatus Endonucleobacter bathymodioli]
MLMIRGLSDNSNVEKEAIRVLADCLNAKKIYLSECTKIQLLNTLSSFSYQNGLRIEKAIQKIADFIAKENLDSWDNQELELTAELLVLKTRDFHHHAINNIASQILKRSKNSLVDDHINISIILNRGRGDSCLALTRNIANEVNDNSFDISSRSPIFLAKLISILRIHEDDKYIEEAMNKIPLPLDIATLSSC